MIDFSCYNYLVFKIFKCLQKVVNLQRTIFNLINISLASDKAFAFYPLL
jgi:hypothetical protein